jgi:lambda family phage portal protein
MGSADTATVRAGKSLREQARHLEQNHDLARGALNVLVASVVGPYGITIEPQPRTASGDIHDEFATAIRDLWRDWAQTPEVSWTHDWPSLQRMLCRSWIRDGEVLAQLILGAIPSLNHGTIVPFSVEAIEADHLAFDLNRNETPEITAGVERNAWGRTVAYHLYKQHPGDMMRLPTGSDIKRVSADNVLHIKMVDRIRQARGVSVFGSVLLRLDDIKDYEESERIAAKVAASMAAFIKKGAPDFYSADHSGEPRDLKFRPGMIFDDLLPGEEIGLIDSKRPNAQLEPYRNGQLRAIAAGVGTSYSSLARDYNGTYSAQRQELVESWGNYAVLSAEFSHQFVQPVYQAFINVAVGAGLLRVPRDVAEASINDATYLPPQMPWIDPAKEADAWETLERNGHASGPEIVRRRGQNPTDVLDQEARWRRLADEKGVTLGVTQPKGTSPQMSTQNGENVTALVRTPRR